jgi:hypothetical protein
MYYNKNETAKQTVFKIHGFINRIWTKIPASYNMAPEISSNVLAT